VEGWFCEVGEHSRTSWGRREDGNWEAVVGTPCGEENRGEEQFENVRKFDFGRYPLGGACGRRKRCGITQSRAVARRANVKLGSAYRVEHGSTPTCTIWGTYCKTRVDLTFVYETRAR